MIVSPKTNGGQNLTGLRVARNSGLAFIGHAVPTIVGIVTVPFILQFLGTERFAILSICWLVLGYLGAFDLGLGRAATKYISEAIRSHNGLDISAVVWSASIPQIPFGIALGLTLALLTPWLTSDVLKLSGSIAVETRAAFCVVAFALPTCLLTSVLRGVLEAYERFDLASLIKLPVATASFVLPLLAVKPAIGLAEIVFLMLLTRIASLAAHVVLCLRLVPDLRRGRLCDRPLFLALLSFGGWNTISTAVQQFQLYLERMLLGALIGVGAVAYYSAPSDMISRLSIVPLSVSSALFPNFSDMAVASGERIVQLMARSLKYLQLTIAPICAVIFVFTPNILGLWLGEDFAQEATLCTRILIACFLLNAIGYIPLAVIHGQGRPSWKAKLDLLELPCFLVMAFYWIPKFGIAGVALAKLVVQIVDLTALFVMVKQIFRLKSVQLFPEGCKEAALASSILAVAAVAVVVAPYGVWEAGSILSVGLGLFTFLSWKLAMDDRDWFFLMSAIRLFRK